MLELGGSTAASSWSESEVWGALRRTAGGAEGGMGLLGQERFSRVDVSETQHVSFFSGSAKLFGGQLSWGDAATRRPLP